MGPVRKPHCWFSHEAAQMTIAINAPQNEPLPEFENEKMVYFAVCCYELCCVNTYGLEKMF